MLVRKFEIFAGLVVALVGSTHSAKSDVVTSGTVSDEFDMPPLTHSFKTSPPEGPSTTALADDRNVRVVVTSSNQPKFRHHDARPGVRQTLTTRRQGRRDSGSGFYTRTTRPHSSSSSPKTCQYIFTVENAAECTHTTTEIAVHHVTRTILPSTNALNELSERLHNLERAVYGSASPLTAEPMLGDSAAIAEINARNVEEAPVTNASAEEKTKTDNLVEIAKNLVKQLVDLERGITRSEKEKQDLQTQNKNLILTLRRSAAARKKFVSLKANLENSLRQLREENARLLSTNRTTARQNTALMSRNSRLESVQESFRSRIRSLEAENERIEQETVECEQKRSNLLSVKNQLTVRMSNLTKMVDRCTMVSYEDESARYELEKERERNELLDAENVKLQKQLQNATGRIKQLLEERREVEIASADGMNFNIKLSDRRDDQDYSYCGRITSISKPQTIRGPQTYLEKQGVWMMDPLEALGGGKVWSINTVKDRVKELKQYESLRKFAMNQPEVVMPLPVLVESNGGVVYNGSFYYQRRNSRKLVRYDIKLKRVIRERPVHRAGFHAAFAYQWGGLTDIDLAVDEFGLWVIYSTRQNNGKIVIARLNPLTLRPISTSKTSIPKRSVANAFMACGILYTVDSYDSANASLNHEFDTYRKRSRRISIPFANQHRFNVMVDYNPRTREIFSWDNSHQVKYYVTLDQSLGKITELTKRQRRRKRG